MKTESQESTRVMPAVKSRGKRMISLVGMLAVPVFASAETPSKAISELVSNPKENTTPTGNSFPFS